MNCIGSSFFGRLGPQIFASVVFFVGLLSGDQSAQAASQICRTVALHAAQSTGVPAHVLLQLATSQSGSGRKPGSPWSVRFNGEDIQQFATRDAAEAYVFARFMRGARLFAIGCFQVRYGRHQDAFETIEEMFDPDKNALHTARMLRTEHARYNTWRDAVAAYRAAEAKFIMRSMQRERSNGLNLNAHLLTTSNSTTLGAM